MVSSRNSMRGTRCPPLEKSLAATKKAAGVVRRPRRELVLTRISLEERPPDGGAGGVTRGPADVDGKKLPRPRSNGSLGEPSTICSVQHLVHFRGLLSDCRVTLRDARHRCQGNKKGGAWCVVRQDRDGRRKAEDGSQNHRDLDDPQVTTHHGLQPMASITVRRPRSRLGPRSIRKTRRPLSFRAR